jgi:tripartite-type tricarboxylate transporter receptor subunit TctC
MASKASRCAFFFCCLLAWLPVASHAQTWPAQPVRIVSSYLAGGPNDVFSRIVAGKLSERLGQPVVVENRTGADGRIGAEAVARAAPDGYTLLTLALAHTAHEALYGKLPYDVERDFAPISRVAALPLLLVVKSGLEAKSVSDFVALAKTKPGALNYASGGNGTSQHLAMEMLASVASIRMQHVPYRGLGPVFADMLNGQIDALMSPIASALPHVKAGKLRALGITTAQRSPLLPEVPTITESGLPGVQIDTWHGIVAPAGTPPAVVSRLHAEIAASLKGEDIREAFARQGAFPVGNTPAEFAAEIRAEQTRWSRLVRERGIKPD